MTTRTSSQDRLERYLRCRLAEETTKERPQFRPSITISRQCGAGLDGIAEKLIEYLDEVDDSTSHGWALFDKTLVETVIEGHHLPDSVLPYLAEITKFPVIEAFEELLNLHPSNWTLFNYTAMSIRKLCRMGNIIVVGRAGNFVTSDLKNTFHLRLVGTEKIRIWNISKSHQTSTQEAKKFIKETDQARAKYVKHYTEADINNPDFYHLIVNTDNLGDEVLVRILADNVLEWANAAEKEISKITSI